MAAFPVASNDWLALNEQRARCESELIDQVRAVLVRVEDKDTQDMIEALAHLEAGTYGYCVDCHRAIAAGDLDVAPFAPRCAECERGRQTGRPDITAGSDRPVLMN